jgi:nucleoside-diphosphate-sugar epimerase
VPIDEKHPLQAQSPYSASKIGADAIAISFFNAFNLPVTIVRPFNTYGPRQSARAVIPTVISQIASGKKQIKLGDVSPTRDFNYVADTCRGFLSLARCDKAIGETVNIGSNFEISVGDTLSLIRELMNSDVEFLIDEQRIRPPAASGVGAARVLPGEVRDDVIEPSADQAGGHRPQGDRDHVLGVAAPVAPAAPHERDAGECRQRDAQITTDRFAAQVDGFPAKRFNQIDQIVDTLRAVLSRID